MNLGRQVEQDYALDGTHRDKATDYTYSTSTDDLLTQIDYGEVTGNSDGTFSDTGTDKRSTLVRLYAASSSVNLSCPSRRKSSTPPQHRFRPETLLRQPAVRPSTLGNNYAPGRLDQRQHLRKLHQDLQRLWPGRHLDRPPRLCHRLQIRRVQSLRRHRHQSAQSKDAISLQLRQRQTEARHRSQQPSHQESLRRRRPPRSKSDQSDVSNPALLATTTLYQYTDNSTPPSIIHRIDYLTATNTVDTYDYYDGLNRLVQERKASQTAGTFAATDQDLQLRRLARLTKPSLFLLRL